MENCYVPLEHVSWNGVINLFLKLVEHLILVNNLKNKSKLKNPTKIIIIWRISAFLFINSINKFNKY